MQCDVFFARLLPLSSKTTRQLLPRAYPHTAFATNCCRGAPFHTRIEGGNIYIEKDGTLSAVNEVTPDEVITLAAAETVSIYNEKLGGIINGNVDMAAGSTYQADGAHLGVKNGTLTFNATSDEKINLVLTLQAQYETDSQVLLFTDVKTVEFIPDNASANIIGESIILNAADYFCGDWINENTELIYDGSSVYVTGVNQVSGT